MTSSDDKSSSSLANLKYFNFFMYGTWSLLAPFLPLYFQNVGFNSVQIGLLMSVGPIVSIVANPFWGYWSDRLQNARLIIIIMLAGNMVLSQVYFRMHEFYAVFVMMLLFYFFQTALNPISNSLILRTIENTGHQFGTFRLWGSIGFAVMVLISSPFIDWMGIDKLGYLYGLFLLVTIVLSVRLPHEGKKSGGTRFSVKELSAIVVNPYFAAFLLLSVLISIPNRMNSTFISIVVDRLGGSEVYVGWSWFFAAILEVPVFMLLDRYLKKTPGAMFALMAAVGALYALRWGLMCVAAAPYHVMLIQLLHSVTFGLSFYTGTQICDYLVPDKYRTSGQAVYGLMWMGVAGILAGIVGGYMFDVTGPKMMYGASAVMSLAGMAGFLLLWRLFTGKSRQAGQGHATRSAD